MSLSLQLPSTESIECFVAAAELLNFRAAAKAVSLTPAALGKRVQQLERQFKIQLFVRTTRRVELTEAGLALLPHARQLLETGRACYRAARGEVGPAPVQLTVGTRQELGLSWLLPLLERIEKPMPYLTTHLYFGSGPDLELRVRTAEIDCAISSRPSQDPRIDSFRLHQEDYALVASPKLLKKRPLTRPEHATQHTLLDVQSELPLFQYWRSAPQGGDRLHFGQIRVLGTIAAIRQVVLRGRGVAVLPLYQVRPDLKAKRLRSVFPSVKLRHDHFRLIFRRNDPRRSLFGTLAELMLGFPLQ